MITIEDHDFPIDVAAKLIAGTKEIDSMITREINKRLGGDGTQDMFDNDELKEIADHIYIYLKNSESKQEETGEKGIKVSRRLESLKSEYNAYHLDNNDYWRGIKHAIDIMEEHTT